MVAKASDSENLRHLPVGDLRNPDFGPYRNDNRLLPSYLRGAGNRLDLRASGEPEPKNLEPRLAMTLRGARPQTSHEQT